LWAVISTIGFTKSYWLSQKLSGIYHNLNLQSSDAVETKLSLKWLKLKSNTGPLWPIILGWLGSNLQNLLFLNKLRAPPPPLCQANPIYFPFPFIYTASVTFLDGFIYSKHDRVSDPFKFLNLSFYYFILFIIFYLLLIYIFCIID
jgi:hypothetical protein